MAIFTTPTIVTDATKHWNLKNDIYNSCEYGIEIVITDMSFNYHLICLPIFWPIYAVIIIEALDSFEIVTIFHTVFASWIVTH